MSQTEDAKEESSEMRPRTSFSQLRKRRPKGALDSRKSTQNCPLHYHHSHGTALPFEEALFSLPSLSETSFSPTSNKHSWEHAVTDVTNVSLAAGVRPFPPEALKREASGACWMLWFVIPTQTLQENHG